MKYDWSNPQDQAVVKALYDKACAAEPPKPVIKLVADTDEYLEGYWPEDGELCTLRDAAFRAGIRYDERISLGHQGFKDEAEFYRLLSHYEMVAAGRERKYREEDHQRQLLFFCACALFAGFFLGLGWYLSN